MPDLVPESYDEIAPLYAELFLREIEGDTNASRWLAAFADLVSERSGVVADLGCGPGHIVDRLCGLGLNAVGYDLSTGQIAQARTAFPKLEFHVGDLTALEAPDASLAGIVSRYSVIHLDPSCHDEVFTEWMRALMPGAPLLVSFFGSISVDTHGTPFGHTVSTAYELSPTTIARQLEDTGFVDVEFGRCDPPEGGRPFDQATVLARRPAR